jgi:hypothetical protein
LFFPSLVFLAVVISGPYLLPQQLDEGDVQQIVPAQSSLTLIQSGNSGFEGLLDTYFPGVSSLPNYQALGPFLVIARNDTPLTAKAYAIEWHIHYPDGTISSIVTRHFATRLMFPLQMKSIKPQDMRLVGPLLNVNPAEYQKYFVANPGVLAQIYQAHQLPPVPNGGSVDAVIDGVIFADGSSAGPNNLHLWERYVAARNAEHDEALAVFNLLKASTPPAEMLQVLRRRLQRGRAANFPENEEKTWYLEARASTARDLLRIWLRQGSDALLTAANNVANYGKPRGLFTNMASWK